MIGISKLYCGVVEPSDVLRYGRKSNKLSPHLLQFSSDKKPVVVWNVTRRCNLHCMHCYSSSRNIEYSDELSTKEGYALIDDLAQFGAPVILFSGGEPLMRKDLLDLASYATKSGVRAVISTNGTLISRDVARDLKKVGLSYVGVSLDGLRPTNDKFRGVQGSFDRALEGIRNCQKEGIKVGLRFTMNKHNVEDIPEIFKLLEQENIPRVCFYHLVYAGRGSALIKEDLSHQKTRQTVDKIIDLTYDMHSRGYPKEVLTVANHSDGIYLYQRMVREGHERASDVLELLQMNQGNSSGNGIGCISWNGEVHADQFWRHYSFGNVRKRKFSEIWTDLSNPLMEKLKDKTPHLSGRCVNCRWKNICGGNLRLRAEAVTGDLWETDPACYLTDEEISPGPGDENMETISYNEPVHLDKI
jgi:12,18-didecarboxysiroheme deacetylase